MTTLKFIVSELLAKSRKGNTSRGNGIRDHGEVCAGAQRDPRWYDRSFEGADHWKLHYTKSRYYFFWSVIADRMRLGGIGAVLDIGCGPGQFACVVRDRGVPQYVGVDFSEKRIDQAQRVCPEYAFYCEDAFRTDKFDMVAYDAVVLTEFLEHVNNDLGILRRIRTGARVFASVPNFPYESHVRYFSAADDVQERYSPMFRSFRVDPFIGDANGTTYFLIDGVKG